MEEGSSDTTSNTKRIDELLDQLGTRYDQSLPGLLDDVSVTPSTSANETPPLPGRWLSDLKRPNQAQASAGPVIMPSQSLEDANDNGSQPGIIAPQGLAYPQMQGEWASKRVSQSGIQSEPVAPRKARTTDKLDEKLLLFQASAPENPMPDTETPPPQKAPITPGFVRIPPDPPRQSPRSGKRRYSIQIIVCVVLLSVAGISWLLQQVNLIPAAPSPETQKQTSSAATPINTPGFQVTPVPTSTASHQPTKTPTKVKPTPTAKPTQPPVAPTTPPTQVAKPPASTPGIISFEDGGLDGWVHSDPDGTVTAIKNLTVSNAKDGSHVLMIAYDSDNDQSYPTFETGQLPKSLKAGQTVRVYILKTQGSNVEASLYIADQNDTWYKSTSDSNTAYVNSAQTWYPVSFTVPSNIQGSVTKVGIILFGYNAVVYIDAYSW